MKNTLLTLASLLMLSLSASAAGADDFAVDRELINQELSELNQIEALVLENGFDYNDLQAKTDLNLALLAPESSLGALGLSEKPLGVPSFVWGLCLGWVGLLVVFIMNDDDPDKKKEVNNALYGCIASTVIGVIVYFVIFAAAAGTVASASNGL